MAKIGKFTLVVLAEKKMICIIIDYAIIGTNDLQKLYEWLKCTSLVKILGKILQDLAILALARQDIAR